jgi:hypothetical protein
MASARGRNRLSSHAGIAKSLGRKQITSLI